MRSAIVVLMGFDPAVGMLKFWETTPQPDNVRGDVRIVGIVAF
jgi:hypothetical protein